MGKWGGILPTSRLLLLAVVAAATCIGAPVRAEKRVALVIGNDRYANLPAERQLQKAVNDAEAVGDTLARLGFEVIRGRNLGRQGIIDKLSELTAKLAPGDTAAFFYAGHGVAIGGINYLVPSDAPLVTPDAEARVRGASVSEPDLIAEIHSKSPRVAFLAIDACRDNPFPRSGGRSIGQTRGLAEAKPVRGVFTVYSAGIGQTALDRLEPQRPRSQFGVHAGVRRAVGQTGRRSRQSCRRGARTRGITAPADAGLLRSDRRRTRVSRRPAVRCAAGRCIAAAHRATAAVQAGHADGHARSRPFDVERRCRLLAAKQVGTCGAYEAFVRSFKGTFEATLAEEHLKASCPRTSPQPTVAANPPVVPPAPTRTFRVLTGVSEGILNVSQRSGHRPFARDCHPGRSG